MMTSQPNAPNSGSLSGSPTPSSARPTQSQDLSYMHRPPTIMPNYGKKQSAGVKLKTNVPRVLLYDNVTQQTILEFQLNGLQSQQHKISRELEMHMKSFTLRSKRRERSLKNITKVPHFSDYEEFLEHHDPHPRRLLPRVSSFRNGMVTSSSFRHKKSRGSKGKKTQSVSTFSREQSEFMSQNGKEHHKPADELGLLPRIDNATSTSLISSKSCEQVQNFEPKRQVGFKMEKGSKGVTRLFHTLPAVEVSEAGDKSTEVPVSEPVTEPQPVTVPMAEVEAQEGAEHREDAEQAAVTTADDTALIGAIRDANLPEMNEAIPLSREPSRVNEIAVHPTKASNSSTTQNANEVVGLDDVDPLQDQRFELLQQALVLQDPPNDGFIELSPSFVRSYPDVSFLNEFKQVVARVRAKTEGEEARVDVKSELSGFSSVGNPTQTDDEEDEEEEEAKDTGALKKLGNF